jgi:PAS domain S-box-containing protein
MDEVSAKAASMILEALDEAGVGVESLVDGLPLSRGGLPRARIDWNVFTELLARIEARCGDSLPMEEIGARILKVPSFEFLRRAGQSVLSPKQLYEIANRLVAPALFSNVIVRQEWLPSGRLVVTGDILPGYRESKAFFRLCHGNVAALPRLLDLPASIIEEQAIAGRRGRLLLLPPASHTLAARFVRGARGLGSLGEMWRGVARQQREIEESMAVLRTSRHEFQQLIERLPDGVLIQRNGVVRWANAAFLEIVGAMRLDEIVGRPLLDFVPPDDRDALALAMHRAAMSEVTDARPEYRVARTDGTLRRVQAGTAQLVDFEGEPARLVVLRDVTDYHRMREKAGIADRLASIGALAAGVAHEINNPLAYVRFSVDIATREAAALGDDARTGELRASLARAREGTDRVLGIVRDLKTLSRVHDEPTESVDLPALLDATLGLAGGLITAKAQLVRSYGPTPPASATRGGLGQVFLNLLTNAADAIPEGCVSTHLVRVATRTDATGRAVVEITDSGGGIAPDVAARVFDPFFTTKPVGQGTGLGLAMCHRIVTELGGAIAFESAPGETIFRVTLPAAAATEREAPPSERSDVVPDSSVRRRVLVVDDEPRLLQTIVKMLANAHDVVTAATVRQALEILGDGTQFDAVIADLMMADLTGMDLYDAVREGHPGLERKFVFMTGGAFTRRAQEFLSVVPNRCIEKPFAVGELIRAVDALVLAEAS